MYKSGFIDFHLFNSSVICLNAKNMGKTEILDDIHECIKDNWPAKEEYFVRTARNDIGQWLEDNLHGDAVTDHSLGCSGATGYIDDVNNDLVFMLIWSELETSRILVHECVHAANRIIEGLGINLPETSDHDELQAIVVDYIYSQVKVLFENDE